MDLLQQHRKTEGHQCAKKIKGMYVHVDVLYSMGCNKLCFRGVLFL